MISIGHYQNKIQKNVNEIIVAETLHKLNYFGKKVTQEKKNVDYENIFKSSPIFKNKTNPHYHKLVDEAFNQDFQVEIVDELSKPFPGLAHTKKLFTFWVKICKLIKIHSFMSKNDEDVEFKLEENDGEYNYYQLSVPITRSLTYVYLSLKALGKHVVNGSDMVSSFTTPCFIVHTNFEFSSGKKSEDAVKGEAELRFFRLQNFFLRATFSSGDLLLKLEYFMATVPFQASKKKSITSHKGHNLHLSFQNVDTGVFHHFDWITNRKDFSKTSQSITFTVNSLPLGTYLVGINYCSTQHHNKNSFDYQFELVIQNNYTAISSTANAATSLPLEISPKIINLDNIQNPTKRKRSSKNESDNDNSYQSDEEDSSDNLSSAISTTNSSTSIINNNSTLLNSYQLSPEITQHLIDNQIIGFSLNNVPFSAVAPYINPLNNPMVESESFISSPLDSSISAPVYNNASVQVTPIILPIQSSNSFNNALAYDPSLYSCSPSSSTCSSPYLSSPSSPISSPPSPLLSETSSDSPVKDLFSKVGQLSKEDKNKFLKLINEYEQYQQQPQQPQLALYNVIYDPSVCQSDNELEQQLEQPQQDSKEIKTEFEFEEDIINSSQPSNICFNQTNFLTNSSNLLLGFNDQQQFEQQQQQQQPLQLSSSTVTYLPNDYHAFDSDTDEENGDRPMKKLKSSSNSLNTFSLYSSLSNTFNLQNLL